MKTSIQRCVRAIVLPKEISSFEARYLRRMNKIGLVFFALHVPAMALLAWVNGTGPWLALALTSAVLAGPAIAYATLSNPRSVSISFGVAAMFVGGLLVHFGQGPMQIEMHFYFFALIAMLAVFGNPLVIIAAAVTVALHHLALWFLLPKSVFNYDAPVWVVAVHAVFVVLDSIAACFIARSFFDNVIGLEKIVEARTKELDARNRDMRLVLDNVAQGFATIDRRGVLSQERSCALDRWFGAPHEGQTVFDVFARCDADFGERSRLAFEQVTDGFLPLELALEQMPRDLVLGDKQYRVTYLAIGREDGPEHFLLVVTDVTAEVNEERSTLEREEAMLLFERLLADRNAVRDFAEEASAFVDAVCAGHARSNAELQRMLHTLKGNSAIFGLRSLSALCHELETQVIEEGAASASSMRALRDRWAAVSQSIDRWLGARPRVIELESEHHAALEHAVLSAPRATVLSMVQALKLEPTARRLGHFAEQARRIAARLGKEVDVEVDGRGLRVDSKQWAGFWSAFIHAVRNAVDHGIESAAVRRAAGKPERGAIALGTYLRGDSFVVEISDDGAGIDWSKLAEKARALGMRAETAEELREALFRDGVSTAASVTDISGRGLGMGALREAAEALGGRVEVESKRGRGSTLRMVFPRSAMSVASRVPTSFGAPENGAVQEQVQ